MKIRTIDKDQIDHFAKDSADWWDENGPFRPLHRLNPARLSFIRDTLVEYFDLDNSKIKALTNLQILDIGCGGGLVSEPLSHLGADMTSVDADANAIKTAKSHAKENNLKINYICGAAEDLVEEGQKFDVVLALEIIEHTSSPDDFVELCSKLCRKGGIVIFSTLNRNLKSYALGIIAAEHLLRWVAPGTHEWKRFVKPSELAEMAENNKLQLKDVKGLIYNPITNEFSIHPHDVDVNYFLVAQKQ